MPLRRRSPQILCHSPTGAGGNLNESRHL